MFTLFCFLGWLGYSQVAKKKKFLISEYIYLLTTVVFFFLSRKTKSISQK